ncbi:HTH domain-containing protein [Nocardia sp. NPDC019255]|uniref:HTH domain-containing protein n=1 Tax=Nocardia sp. NPDC019255 TaxID=3154591 RepID=UPI0033FA438C
MLGPTGRVLTLLELLQSGGTRTVAELADRLGVEGRAVRRYVDQHANPVASQLFDRIGHDMVEGGEDSFEQVTGIDTQQRSEMIHELLLGHRIAFEVGKQSFFPPSREKTRSSASGARPSRTQKPRSAPWNEVVTTPTKSASQ